MKTARLCFPIFLLLTACASTSPDQPRIAELQDKPLIFPPVKESAIDPDTALKTYQTFLKNAPDGPAYREALRRSADVELESAERLGPQSERSISEQAAAQKAIKIYRHYLNKYPTDENNERILYQLAKAYDINGQMENSLTTLGQLLHQYPNGHYAEEALFRSGEMYFSIRNNAAAERSFENIINKYPTSIYFERALYMAGWSKYLQNRFDDSIQTFFALLDLKLSGDELVGDVLSSQVSTADRELLDDSLKVICLALSYQGIKDPIGANFDRHGDSPYEALIYRRLGEFYLAKQRYLDAANTYMNMTRRHPDHSLAPKFHHYAIEAYKNGGFTDLFFTAKSDFVKNYGVDSQYWQSHDEAIRQQIRPFLATDIKDLAANSHSIARRTKNAKDFDDAVSWYREYLKTFSIGADTAEMNFMLAECLHDAKRYKEAVVEYEKSAYEYDPHKNSAESAYAALLTYKEISSQIPENEREPWRRRAIASAIHFSDRFPGDSRVDEVLASTVDELFAMHDYPAVIDAAQRLLKRPEQQDKSLRKNAWIILGHAFFETAEYLEAQKAYQAALQLLAADDIQRPKITENLAASMYKQGEQKRDEGDLKGAVTIFLQIEKNAPAPSIWVAAQYDATAALIELKDWDTAAPLLEDLRRRHLGDAHLQHGVTEKLALVYSKSGQNLKAAREMETLSTSPEDATKRRALVWEAAALYQETGAKHDAIRLYKRYIKEFPAAFAEGIEARHNLSTLYKRLNNPKESSYWLHEIIKADKDAGSARSDRSRQLAGEATLLVAKPLVQAYQRAKLTLPLKKSLKIKKSLMEKAITMYKKALEYRVAEISTEATYQLGDIYDNFSKAISASDRPQGLSKDELEQYNILLEDQTYLFQDKAIQLHEANVKHIDDGIYDNWIKDSLKALAKLYPVRYAKTEESEEYFDAAR